MVKELVVKLTAVIPCGTPFANIGCAAAWVRQLEQGSVELLGADATVVVDSIEDNEWSRREREDRKREVKP
jgi:hypothetical protein